MPLIKNKVEHKLKSFINAKTVCEFANKSLEYKAEILLGFCINFVSECIKNGKSFDGTLTNLNSEVKALVFNNLFPQVKIS
uniref:Uncharacterized protein n=1 Tax=Panagrolaimus superbus TaxID=310955 RepID=A0A914Z7H8_9BILA